LSIQLNAHFVNVFKLNAFLTSSSPCLRRAGEDGQLTRESNARFVKWSDGSESIVLGDEVLNVTRQPHAKAHTHLYAVSGAAVTVNCSCRFD
jgi:hypothetical protein